ncbi:MAG TPA: DUF1810 domain-containing protein [Burkholderiaceae bacterium]|nr:DUF1810 domain-containing protein [Burkholderiaceae bacterium]
MDDPHDLQRFVNAQEPVIEQVFQELRAGRKQSHWMWFVFPQIQGLGGSPMARRFAISSLDEARAYLRHPVLGERLRRCTRLVNAIEGCSLGQVMAYPDDLKFRSCMTLFAQAGEDVQVFADALDKYCGGEPDEKTLAILGLR